MMHSNAWQKIRLPRKNSYTIEEKWQSWMTRLIYIYWSFVLEKLKPKLAWLNRLLLMLFYFQMSEQEPSLQWVCEFLWILGQEWWNDTISKHCAFFASPIYCSQNCVACWLCSVAMHIMKNVHHILNQFAWIYLHMHKKGTTPSCIRSSVLVSILLYTVYFILDDSILTWSSEVFFFWQPIRCLNNFAYTLQHSMDNSGSCLHADTWKTNQVILGKYHDSLV